MAYKIYRGGLYYADLSPAQGSEQGGYRPVVAVQNTTGNIHAPTTIIIPLTTATTKKPLPTHTVIAATALSGLKQDSTALAEQVRVIDKERIKSVIGRVSAEELEAIDQALRISLEL